MIDRKMVLTHLASITNKADGKNVNLQEQELVSVTNPRTGKTVQLPPDLASQAQNEFAKQSKRAQEEEEENARWVEGPGGRPIPGALSSDEREWRNITNRSNLNYDDYNKLYDLAGRLGPEKQREFGFLPRTGMWADIGQDLARRQMDDYNKEMLQTGAKGYGRDKGLYGMATFSKNPYARASAANLINRTYQERQGVEKEVRNQWKGKTQQDFWDDFIARNPTLAQNPYIQKLNSRRFDQPQTPPGTEGDPAFDEYRKAFGVQPKSGFGDQPKPGMANKPQTPAGTEGDPAWDAYRKNFQ